MKPQVLTMTVSQSLLWRSKKTLCPCAFSRAARFSLSTVFLEQPRVMMLILIVDSGQLFEEAVDEFVGVEEL